MHTPGPWKVKVDQYNAHAIKGPDGKSVASVIQRRPEVSDNARLIAAAPDMLEVLKALILLSTETDSERSREWTLFQKLLQESDVGHMVRAVVAKAEGDV